MEGWRKYWGKTDREEGFHLLAYHCLDVAAVGSTLLRMRPSWHRALTKVAGFESDGLTEAVVFLLAIHDLGKFGNGFQALAPDIVLRLNRVPQNVANRPRHDALGKLLWEELSHPSSQLACPEALLELREASGAPLSNRASRAHLKPWISAVTGHHGRPPHVEEQSNAVLPDHFGVRDPNGNWKDAAALIVELRRLLQPMPLVFQASTEEGDSDRLLRSSWWLSGFAILCDWLGSNTTWFQYEDDHSLPLEDYWAQSLERAEQAVEGVGLAPRKPRTFGGFQQIFPGIEAPSPLQETVATLPLSEGPQLLLIEDLTGSGKTEAALTWIARLFDAEEADGLYFALPTMATANAMYARVSAVMERIFETDPSPALVLAHSGPHLIPTPSSLEQAPLPKDDGGYGGGEETASQGAKSWFADNRKKALLADAGIGTIDQALVGVLRAKHASLRLLGLHHHVLVVDEVHACDDYMNGLLEVLLETQAALGGSVVLLSATLSLDTRDKLLTAFRRGLGDVKEKKLSDAAYPALVRVAAEGTEVHGLEVRVGTSRRIPVAFLHSFEDAVSWCELQAREGRCVAWIRNTVRDAAMAFDELVSRLGSDRVQLFHARFPLGDRLKLEQDIVSRFGKGGSAVERAGRIVVATQVIEQSLDVDFDELLTDLAPIDRVIQRAGRLQRHQRSNRRPPTLTVLAPNHESAWLEPGLQPIFRGTKRVYRRGSRLLRSQQALLREGELDLPSRARHLVESVYGEVDELSVEIEDSREELMAEGEEQNQRSMARFNRISFDLGYTFEGAPWRDDESVPTRLGDPSVILRLVRLRDGQLVPWSLEEKLPEAIRWRLGEVSVRVDQVSAAGPQEESIRQLLREKGAEPPAHIVPIQMEPCDTGWRGFAVASKGDRVLPVEVRFEDRRGLEFRSGERGEA